MSDNTEANGDKSEIKRQISKLSIFGMLAAAATLLAILLLTKPESGPTTIVAALVCLFIFSLSVANMLITKASWIISNRQLKQTRSFYLSLLVSTGVVFVIGLQTLGQLEMSDVILTAAFVLILGFYILRRL